MKNKTISKSKSFKLDKKKTVSKYLEANIKNSSKKRVFEPLTKESVKEKTEFKTEEKCLCCEEDCKCCDHPSGTVGHKCLCRCHAE